MFDNFNEEKKNEAGMNTEPTAEPAQNQPQSPQAPQYGGYAENYQQNNTVSQPVNAPEYSEQPPNIYVSSADRPRWGGEMPHNPTAPQQNQNINQQYNANTQPSHYSTSTGFEGQSQIKQTENYRWNSSDYRQTSAPPVPPKKNKGLFVFTSIIAVIFGVTLITFAAYGAFSMINAPQEESELPQSSSPSEAQVQVPNITINNKPEVSQQMPVDGTLSSVDIAQMVAPSVVAIEAYNSGGFTATSQGSGIIMSSDGYIITNAHVVEGSSGVKVVLHNGEAYSAELIGYDTQTDLAVVKIEEENLSYVTFGNSDEIQVGEKVLAIGNSWGMQGTVTQGIISGIDRVVTGESGYDMNFMQVDAAINPGNSGGALVNEYGQVIGINSAKFVSEDVEGIGFAIPINEATPIIEDLILNGRVTGRAKLGIEGAAIDVVDSRMYGVPVGVQIMNIQSDSDLINKGIIPGDIITAIDDTDITSFDDLKNVITDKKPGDTVHLKIYRPNNNPVLSTTFEVDVLLVEDK